jgi:hypothetical protein
MQMNTGTVYIETIKYIENLKKNISAQCCGFGIFIPDPDQNFFHPGFRAKKLLDPGSVSKNLSILTQKIVSKLLEK